MIEAERRPTARRRAAAALAILLGAVTLAGALLAVVRDLPVGVAALAGVALALWLVWQGAIRRATARAALVCAGLVVVISVLGLLAERSLIVQLLLVGAGAAAATVAVKVALGPSGAAGGAWRPAQTLGRPVLFVNPRSGDGKAQRLNLVAEARARGIEPVVLQPGDDLAMLARRAVAEGADALGTAGGDGSLAVVAAIAVEHGLPFVCIPAGTRNHLALDLGIDRQDPVGALDAFTDGVERRIDLAEVNGHAFVNNVSLGVYGEAIRRPGYRAAKLRTVLDTLPDTFGPTAVGPRLRLTDDLGHDRTDVITVLVSNNPYASDRMLGRGSLPALDTGQLGIVVGGRPGEDRQNTMRAWSAPAFRCSAAAPIHAGADGEAIVLQPPLRFEIRHAVLRVRISARHPGLSPAARLPQTAWSTVPRLLHIAAG